MRLMSAELGVRPPRVALFVPEVDDVPWQRSFDMALGRVCSIWGGVSYLPFPLSPDLADHELFWRIADIFDADGYEVAHPTAADLADLDRPWREASVANLRGRFAEMTDEDLDEYLSNGALTSGSIDEGLARMLVHRLAPLGAEHYLDMLDGGLSILGHITEMAASDLVDLPAVVHTVRTDDPLHSLLVTAELGRLSRRTQRVLSERGVDVIEVPVTSAAEVSRYLFSDRDGTEAWPWSLTLAGLETYSFGWQRRAPVIVVGDDVWDFVLFYALRRLGTWAWWLPSEFRSDELLAWRFKNRVLSGRWNSGPNPAVTSYSAPQACEEIANWLADDDAPAKGTTRSVEPSVEHWSVLLPEFGNRLYERGGEGQALGIVVEGDVSSPLPTPLLDTIRHRNEIETQWMVDARVEGWSPVRHPSLASTLFSGPKTSDYLQRPSIDGAVYVATGTIQLANTPLTSLAVRPRLHTLPLLRQVQTILASRGWKAEPSDKGAYAQRASDMFGGLHGLAEALRDATNRRILHAYLSGKTEPNAVGYWMQSERRRLLTRDALAKLLGDGDQADASLADLLRRETLQLGTVLKCRRCRQTAWYDVDAFGRTFTCTRCRFEQVADSTSWLGQPEPRWSYRLDEAFLQFLRHNGDLPVLAAAQLVGDRYGRSDVTFELDVWPPPTDDGDIDKSELDLVISIAGRLIIGEATTSSSLCRGKGEEIARLERLDEVAQTLSARRVVLASSADLRDVTKKRAAAQFPGPWPTLELVSGIEGVPRPAKLVD